MLKFHLEDLNDDEMAILLYVLNFKNKVTCPTMTFESRHLKWFKHDLLVKRVREVFNDVKPEGHSIYSSLLTKMGVQHEIRVETPPLSPITGSTETTGSV
jgi:hypothetical protein